jgi:uncharacterized protein (DUF433 family)
MAVGDYLGVGLYSLAEASHLLRTPRRTLSRWLDGYVLQLRDGYKSYLPVMASKDETVLSFGDLIELMYVRSFRNKGVQLDEIRQVAHSYRHLWNTRYPLATKRFATDGRNLLLEEGEAWRTALSGQQCAFFDEIGEQLVHTGDLASEWRPLGGDRQVVLDPSRAFGKPIDFKSGAHTYILAKAVEAGSTVKEVAWWYETSEGAVQDAVVFEREWGRKRPTAVA